MRSLTMAIDTREDPGKRICDALGLNPHKVYDISIYVAAGAPVSVTVSRYETDETLGALLEVLSHYRLFEIEEDGE
jgi:hypothetical protein